MYTEEDVKRLFALRGEIELELGVMKAQYYAATENMPPELRQRMTQLQCQIMTIDSLFSVLTKNEAFVVKSHLLEGLDWSQISKLYINEWNAEEQKTIRSFQIYQTKALRKIADTINRRLNFHWNDISV